MGLERNHFFTPGENLPASLDKALNREWLETNGLGGYAASTIPRCPTRKYHGLLVQPLPGKQGRFLLLSGLEPEPVLPEGEFFLGSNIYNHTEHPGGYSYLKEFSPFPHPRWRWNGPGFGLDEELLMVRGEAVVLMKYRLTEDSAPLTLRLKPLLSYRDVHQLTFENPGISPSFRSRPENLEITLYPDLPPLEFRFSRPYSFQYSPFWDKGVTYSKERERGFDYQEDRFVPGLFFLELKPGEEVYLSAGLPASPGTAAGVEELWKRETQRRQSARNRFTGGPPALEILAHKAEQFIVKNDKDESSLIAGYPWFGEWGRDTMIALPGLTLATGKKKTAAAILRSYGKYIRKGLIPNTLGGLQGFASYNSIDASLLFVAAVQAADPFLTGSSLFPGELEFEKRFYKPVKAIMKAFLHNKVPHTRLESDGLLSAGSPETQLTWMDATAYGKPVTPRYGKPVDINALWYNNLRYLLELQERMEKKPNRRAEELVAILPMAYRDAFWLPKGEYLADCITPEGPDPSLRPNMLFPLALPYSPLTRKEQLGVLKAVEEHLLTPLGLRTLAPTDPRFCPVYRGNGNERDAAYHQGTVWPWLLELYVIGLVRTNPRNELLRTKLKEYLTNFLEKHLMEDGLGQVSEIFDGEKPAAGRGCFAQAWSSAAILRAWDFIENFPVK